MAWRCGSLSRSLISTARSSSIRTASSSVPRLRPSPPLTANLLQSRRSMFSLPRNIGALGCAQSLMPLHSVVAATRLTPHISVESRACCELSQAPRVLHHLEFEVDQAGLSFEIKDM
ncbi:hypothetical protein LWI29_001993 [Acer saccharum]|uniref:Uncharacterized protein n=1 Tax=Acer saccharum TaxID=4024 RepID=A0AA39VYL3_ACESA|nr:hypothetical protein LWI29_001993 [Acer saccharum]KAK1588216.1 hypothetical protein Q3G72_021006 [Acer saccharum]